VQSGIFSGKELAHKEAHGKREGTGVQKQVNLQLVELLN